MNAVKRYSELRKTLNMTDAINKLEEEIAWEWFLSGNSRPNYHLISDLKEKFIQLRKEDKNE